MTRTARDSDEWQMYHIAFKHPCDEKVIVTHPVWTSGRRKAHRCGLVLLEISQENYDQ